MNPIKKSPDNSYGTILKLSGVTPSGYTPGILPIDAGLYMHTSFHEKFIKKNGVKSKGLGSDASWNKLVYTKKGDDRSLVSRKSNLFTFYPQGITYGVTGLFLPAYSNVGVSPYQGFMIGFSDQQDAAELAGLFKEKRSDYVAVTRDFLSEKGFALNTLEETIQSVDDFFLARDLKKNDTFLNALIRLRETSPKAYKRFIEDIPRDEF